MTQIPKVTVKRLVSEMTGIIVNTCDSEAETESG